MSAYLDLAAEWRERVASPFVPVDVRRAVEACAHELEAAVVERENELLSPKEAAAETGLAPATIRKRLSTGKLPNEGSPNRPRVRRRDLYESTGVARRLRVV